MKNWKFVLIAVILVFTQLMAACTPEPAAPTVAPDCRNRRTHGHSGAG